MMDCPIHLPPTSLTRAEVLDTVPGNVSRYYFPGANVDGGRDGLIVRVMSAAYDWVGVFGFGYRSPPAISAVLGIAGSDVLYIVAAGQAYRVAPRSPESCETIPCVPITRASTASASRLAIFVDFTRICAYDAWGLKWTTERISSDGISVAAVDDDSFCGTAWDAATQRTLNFRVTLADGQVEFER